MMKQASSFTLIMNVHKEYKLNQIHMDLYLSTGIHWKDRLELEEKLEKFLQINPENIFLQGLD